MSVALDVSRSDASPPRAFERGLGAGFGLGLAGLVVSLLHGLRVGFCDLWGGVRLFALGPWAGSVLAGGWGAAAGLVAAGARHRKLVAVALALAGPVGSIGVSLWRFLSSPMVFAFDPFFGHFAGPLYDTVIEPLDRLASYRVGSLLSLLAAGALAHHLERTERGLVLVRRGRPAMALGGVLACAGSVAIALAGPRLGHWTSTASLRAELERSLVSERCEIVYAPSVPEREARLLGRECDAHVREIERWLETRGPDRITVFVFESEAQKGRLVGASSTYIAKPWRREVYVQFARHPHPVLGHELAHVVAGSFGAGPFRVSGPLGGLVPDPGRIEGVATAAAPSDDPELSNAEWSRAMLELGLLPSLESVFRLSFLGENSSKAYTVAGAFVEWLRAEHGARVVREWYGGRSLAELTGGKDLRALEADWRASLARLTLPPASLEAARARFDRPAVFGRRCPHAVDRLVGEAHGRLAQGDVRGARERFERVLALDPSHFGARLGLGSCSVRAGDEADARARLQALADDPKLHAALRLVAEETLADLDLGTPASSERYRRIAAAVSDEDRLRTLDVKASARSEPARRAIGALLVGDLRHGRDFGEAAALLGEWAAAEPATGLADYLLGRNFYNLGRYEEAARRLDRALARQLELGRVQAEALRLRILVACVLEDPAAGRAALARYRALPGPTPAARGAVERVARRCGLE